jgi:AcrR family transcriptional regulator
VTVVPEAGTAGLLDERAAPPYAKLTPGPGKSADEVGAHQRARFGRAMIELAAELGYDKVTVRDLAAIAKVSSRAFYQHFGGKEDCLVHAHELVIRRLAKRIVVAQAQGLDWIDRLRRAFCVLVQEIEHEPAAAHFALVEVCVAGTKGRLQARRAERSFEMMLADGFRRAPGEKPVPPLVVEAIVVGITEVARSMLHRGGDIPPGTADFLLTWVLSCRESAPQAMALRAAPSASRPMADEVPLLSFREARGDASPSSRDLILAATVKLIAKRGHAYLSVSNVCSAASVSSRDFHAHFDDIGDCISAAARPYLENVVESSRRARAHPGDDGARVQMSVLALCNAFARDPILAKLCLAELLVDEAAYRRVSLRRIRDVESVISGDSKHAAVSRRSEVDPTAAMVWGVLKNRIAHGNLSDLLRLAPSLAAFAAGVGVVGDSAEELTVKKRSIGSRAR